MVVAEHRPDTDARTRSDGSGQGGQLAGRLVTAMLVVGPGIAIGVLIPLLWGRAISLRDVLIAVAFYIATGYGIAIGFHRLFSHSSFRPNRILKIALAVVGSMALQGSIIGWVANHRRHHMFSDRVGDPHSPHRYGVGVVAQLRGLAHAHVGWLFHNDETSPDRFAPDLLRDRDVRRVNGLFPVFAVATIAIPFAIGWALTRSLTGGLTALLWAGLVRIVLLHHVTWSINSICHVFGRRPFASNDRSSNFAPLALLSFGESWHNFHHASPSSARHGALPGQVDSAAALIRVFERFGWATNVRWPSASRIATVSVR
jgi:stearoyl-CoA desaturase (delta-9 desaturase)